MSLYVHKTKAFNPITHEVEPREFLIESDVEMTSNILQAISEVFISPVTQLPAVGVGAHCTVRLVSKHGNAEIRWERRS